MSCKNKDNNNKKKDKKIVCETCKCTYDEDNKLRVECKECEDEDNVTIICESCNCINNDNKDKKEVCLKKCSYDGCIEDTIYITCTNYEEDLD